MIQDPANRFIAAIMSQIDIQRKDILEIGCGKGRITRDLARYAKRVVATDPDGAALEKARANNAAPNVDYLLVGDGVPDLPVQSFDAVIYTLSLHHVPVPAMVDSLNRSAALLRASGVIVVIEPGYSGSFIDAKALFGAGSGDERPQQEAAIDAMNAMKGWHSETPIVFRTQVLFDSEEDFLLNMLPEHLQRPDLDREAVSRFLDRHRTPEGIALDAFRRLNVLRRNGNH